MLRYAILKAQVSQVWYLDLGRPESFFPSGPRAAVAVKVQN